MSKRAGAVSAETKEWILQAARDEFSQYGFQKSSLRRISSAAGVTTGAVYFFFDGKDDLFETVLSGVTVPFMAFMRAHYESELQFLSKHPMENQQEDLEVTEFLINSYFNHRQTWDILLQHLNHPAVQRFMDSFADFSTEHYLQMLRLAHGGSPLEHPVDAFDLHQFIHMQADAIMRLISHDFTRKEMLERSKTITKMLRGAFYALLSD